MKRGVVSVQFSWLFTLLAGAVILMFFVGVTIAIQESEQTKLSIDLLQSLDTRFNIASVNERETSVIQSSRSVGLSFTCEFSNRLADDGFISSSFGIMDPEILRQSPHLAVYARNSVEGQDFTLHTEPLLFPYRVDRALYLTTSKTQYVFIRDAADTNFFDELYQSMPSNTSVRVFDSMQAFVDSNPAGAETYVFVTERDGIEPLQFAPSLRPFLNDLSRESTLVLRVLSPAGATDSNRVAFYAYDASNPSGISPFETRGVQATFVDTSTALGAIFSQDTDYYRCSTQKLYNRFEAVSEVYKKRFTDLASTTDQPECRIWYQNAVDAIDTVLSSGTAFYDRNYNVVVLETYLSTMQTLRSNIEGRSCPLLY